MLIQFISEISNLIPTSKISKMDNLVPRLNGEEMNSLYPLIGMPLLLRLRTDYQAIVRDHQELGIWSCCDWSPEEETKVTILRTAQEVLLYTYLANNSATLQSSFNLGGGWNKPGTADYDAPDDKDNKRRDTELWHASLRAKENLLLHLEMDARNLRIYTEWWQQSDYYYLHSDLLFTTPSELHPLYINLGDTPHLNFQSYISILHDCQDGYLAGTIGYPLLQALIERKYQQAPAPDGSPVGENSQLSTLNSQLWLPLDRHVRTALANFAFYEHQGAKQSLDHLLHRGKSQLTLATKYIHDHYTDFLPYIPIGSPLYDPALDPRNQEQANGQNGANGQTKKPAPCGSPAGQPPKPHHGTVFSLLN